MSAPESMSEEDGNTIVIPIDRSFSDGDPAIWPKDPKYKLCNDNTYREKLAVLWLKKMGAYEEGMFIFPFLAFFFLNDILTGYRDELYHRQTTRRLRLS